MGTGHSSYIQFVSDDVLNCIGLLLYICLFLAWTYNNQVSVTFHKIFHKLNVSQLNKIYSTVKEHLMRVLKILKF